jgi:hypothetical protein
MKKQFDAMLISYNLTSKVQIKKISSTATDNVFIDTKLNNYTTDPFQSRCPIINRKLYKPAKPKLSYKNF